jgi:hypothetical protein
VKKRARKTTSKSVNQSLPESPPINHVGRQVQANAVPAIPTEMSSSGHGASRISRTKWALLSRNGAVRAWDGLWHDMNSKVWDGLIPMVVMVLTTLLMHMLAAPVQGLWNTSGLLVYSIALLGLGGVLLNHSVMQNYSEITRGWLGLASGVILWFVILLAERIGGMQMPMQVALMFLIVAGLISATLWKPVFPIGIKFFAMSVLLAAMARIWMNTQQLLVGLWPDFAKTLRVSGFLALGILVVIIVWIVVFSKERMQRLWAALWGWFCALQALSIFLGRSL